MEATAPIMVGLLVGSLILTCILSACTARIFKRRNRKRNEKNGTDLEYAAEKQRYYGHKRTKNEYVQYPNINTNSDSMRPMRLPESSISSNDSSSRYIIPNPSLQARPNNPPTRKQQISAISGAKNNSYAQKLKSPTENKGLKRPKTNQNKTKPYLSSYPPTRAVVY